MRTASTVHTEWKYLLLVVTSCFKRFIPGNHDNVKSFMRVHQEIKSKVQNVTPKIFYFFKLVSKLSDSTTYGRSTREILRKYCKAPHTKTFSQKRFYVFFPRPLCNCYHWIDYISMLLRLAPLRNSQLAAKCHKMTVVIRAISIR